MRKGTHNFTLDEEDVKLVERLKKALQPTHGKISCTAVVRIALRKMEQERKSSGAIKPEE